MSEANAAIRRATEIVGVSVLVRYLLRDPIFSGLHSVTDDDGRGYRDTAHCCYPWHIDGPADRRLTTIVLPTQKAWTIETVVHELGHAFDYHHGFDVTPDPVSSYAETDNLEAFAEAFTSYLIPGYADDPDARSRSWFEDRGLRWWRRGWTT